MTGFLLLCVCLLFGLHLYFRFSIRPWFSFLKKPETASSRQEIEHTTANQIENDSEASGSEYEVFLSFRGPDSRQGLADVLYNDMKTAGIHVYRDDDELDIGDEIEKILPAIENSKICVPVFSQTFAASTWCLREVERMVELRKRVMPVFYTATPDDVKLRTGLFKKDLRKHERRHGREQVKKWEDALKAVARVRGREVKNTGYAQFSKLFVRGLLIKLKVKMKHVTDCHVKREDQEEAVMKLLDIDADGVRLVGIHGMGGIGKTTLAKVVFNRLSARFECCSFLENVRESLRCNGLEHLQKQLVDDLDPKLKHFRWTDSTMMLRENFRKRKVLIILDDVDERKQVEMIAGILGWFDSGSRIIVTTRDRRVLTKERWSYEMQEMTQDQALQLFCRCAFGKYRPSSDYQILSNEVLRLTGRLPLAIEVIGSLLYECDRQRWRATIRKLMKVQDQKIQGKLKISFDVLDHTQRPIFLDIACFFINTERSNAIHMWEACNFYPDDGIEVLVSMSLVKMTKDNVFWMHDVIRDLGREIVRAECYGDPVKRSRIWLRKEASEVLKIKEGKEQVEGLSLEGPCGDGNNMTHEQFLSFRNLRLLQLVGTNLAGDFEHLLPKLKWLSWRRCPPEVAATDLSLENLVVFDLSQSLISENWAGWNLIQKAKRLTVLDLTGCRRLTSTQNLCGNSTLERLILRGCCDLVEIHSSINKLKRLKHLDLRECHSLGRLPEEMGSLKDLEEIILDGNGSPFDLPESIGDLCSLLVIKLHGVELTRIPDSVGGLVNLTCLSLCNCTGTTNLPDAVGDLKLLIELDLSFTNLSALPNTVGGLVKLQSLCLRSTNVQELPPSLGDLKSLEKLDLSSSELRVLPEFVGDLCKLKWMGLDRCKIRELPSSIGKLTRLRILSAHSCSFLKEVPMEIGNLSGLRELYLGDSGIVELPPTLGQLSPLRALWITLHESSSMQKEICSNSSFQWMKNLTSLSWLCFAHSSLTDLPFNAGRLTRLRSMQLCCPGLERIPQLPTSLMELELSRVNRETCLPDFSGLKNLSRIKFTRCSLRDEPRGLRELQMLKHMELSNCTEELVEFSCKLENLRMLSIYHPESSGAFLDLLRLRKLERLKLTDCSELVEVRGLDRLEMLVNLTILNCQSLERVGNLPEPNRVARIHAMECPRLREIGGLEKLSSTYVHIEGCGSMRSTSTS